MNVEEIYQQALNDPELASKLNIDEIISKVDERQNAYLKNETLQTVSRTIYEILSKVDNIKEDTVKLYCEKLKGYRYIDNLCDLRSGLYIRWIRLGDSSTILKNGAFFQNVRIAESTSLLCKNSRNQFFSIRFDDCIIFQKLLPEEEIILSIQNS